ncbi:hypothetical protein ACFLZC_02405 [Patescibacteria group bacterium]
MKKNSLIRTIYLYAFALLGLVLLTISGIRFIDMGLKAFVFTKAEDQEKIYNERPVVPYAIEKYSGAGDDLEIAFTDEEKLAIRNMIDDYAEWKERSDEGDPITSRRHRDASVNLSMIIIGLPLYLYHWIIIKRESKKD